MDRKISQAVSWVGLERKTINQEIKSIVLFLHQLPSESRTNSMNQPQIGLCTSNSTQAATKKIYCVSRAFMVCVSRQLLTSGRVWSSMLLSTP